MMLNTATHLALVRPCEGTAATAVPGVGELLAAMGRAGVHEIVEAEYGAAPACAGLALAALASARPGALLWVAQGGVLREHGGVSARGARHAGLDPARLLCVRTERVADTLWCVEEGLVSGAVSAVVAELSEASFTATRRLVLAAERTGRPALLLMPHHRGGASAAATRWRVAAVPSAADRWDPRAPGRPRWRVMLERARPAPAAAGRCHDLEFDHETLSVAVVSGLADRPPEACVPERRDRAGPGARGRASSGRGWRRAS